MVAGGMIDAPPYSEMLEEMGREISKIIEDYDSAMNAESLRMANKTSELSFAQSVDS